MLCGHDGADALIGVIVKSEQKATVEEFFELFKTPWEWYFPGNAYDVILSTTNDVPDVNPKLLLIFSCCATTLDTHLGHELHAQHHNLLLRGGDTEIPIYGECSTTEEVSRGSPCLTSEVGAAGVRWVESDSTLIRLGYDLFEQVHFLLSNGQPVENAHIPTLENHICMLRNWILEAGIPLLEIPPAPLGHDYIVCLTHDIDFIGIRKHFLDRTMLGFIYRATFGISKNLLHRRITPSEVLRCWWAVLTLPLVYLGLKKDIWEPFEWYLSVEEGLPATYFLIPFKRRPGEDSHRSKSPLRAAAYDVTELAEQVDRLQKCGCEIGVHGIDAWHSVEMGKEEIARSAL